MDSGKEGLAEALAAQLSAGAGTVSLQKDTSNLMDSIAQTGGMPPVLAVAQVGAGFKATLVISALG